jgi:uncharacterized protein
MRLASPEPAGQVGVAVFARAPVPGLTKTRLIPFLGEEGAAGLQGWMLQRTVAMALAADVGPVTLWCEGDIEHRAFIRCRELGPLRIRPQVAGNIGRRMLAAVEESPGTAGTLVIGTDCPVLGVEHLREAARSLADRDAVLIPVEDGGYVLIGMKTPSVGAFAGIDWSTPQVMAQTRQNLAALRWCWTELETLWDVDRPEDVERLAAIFPEVGAIPGRKPDVA